MVDGTLSLTFIHKPDNAHLVFKSVYFQAQLLSEAYQWTRTAHKLGSLNANEYEVLRILRIPNKHDRVPQT